MARWISLLGILGLAGLLGLRYPIDRSRPGAVIRWLGLLGIAGLSGFWIPGAGAIGAAGALSLWNHQNQKLAALGRVGWLFLVGLPFLARSIF